MFAGILFIVFLSIVQISFIRGIYREKTPKIVAFLPILSPIIGVALYYIKEELIFFYVILNFFLIFILAFAPKIKSIVANRAQQKVFPTKPAESKVAEFFNLKEFSTEEVSAKNPLLSVVYRISLIGLVIFATNESVEKHFWDEFQFQILATVSLFFLAIGATLKKIDFNFFKQMVDRRAQETGKKPPEFVKEFDFEKFKKTLYWILVIFFVIFLFAMEVPAKIHAMIFKNEFPYVSYALIAKFVFDLFYVLKQPVSSIKIYALKATQLIQNFGMALFAGLILVISLSLFGLKEFPTAMLGYNAILLYEEILIYKLSIKKNEKNANNS